MANKFQIDITARDKTAEGLRNVNDNFAKLTRGTPLEKVSKGFGTIQEKGRALGNIAKSLFSMGDSASIAAGGIGEAAGGMGALGAAAGVATLGVVAVGAGLGVAAVAAYKFEEQFTKAGAATGYLAQIMGMSTQQLQQFQIAGRMVGVSAEGMAGALQNMGNAMNDAVNGRNQTALALMNKLGIKVHHLKDGSIDAARGMNDLSVAMVNGNAQTKQMIVAQFGVGAAESFMLQSTKDRQRGLEEAARSGAIMTDGQIKDSQKFQKSVVDLDSHWHGLLNAFSQNLVIPWLQPTIDAFDHLFGGLERLLNGAPLSVDAAGNVHVGAAGGAVPGVRDSQGRPAVDTSPIGGGRGGGAKVSAKFASVKKYFESQGWTPPQAAGIAANIQAESGFDPHVVGDHGRALGLGQWHTDRQADFARWAGHSMGMASLQEELAFYQYELTHGKRKGAGDRLRAQTTAYGAAGVVSKYDEGPKDVAGAMATRGRLAEAGLAANGAVHVDVHIKGAPPGSVALASASGPGVTASARIAPTMPGASI